MKYRDFVKKSSKEIDAWVEVFLFDIISNPLGFLLYKLSKRKLTISYFLTLLTFLIKISAAVFFFTGYWIFGAILYITASITDNIDGKIARMIKKEDPIIRCTADFLGDMFSISLIYAAITSYLIIIGEMTSAVLFVIFMGVNIFYMAATSSRFRTQSLSKIRPETKLRDSLDNAGKNKLKVLFKLQSIFAKKRITFYPSAIEAEFLAIVIFPLFLHPILIIIAILILMIDTIAAGLLPTLILIFNKKIK